MTTESYTLAVCNVQKTDTRAQQHATIHSALGRADYVVFNEAGSDAHAILRELDDAVWGVAKLGGASQIPHAWRRETFERDGQGIVTRIMRGGRRVFGRSRRKRRLGPSRFGTARRNRLVRSKLRVRHCGTHLMARVFTAHPERKGLYFASVRVLRSWLWTTRRVGVPDVLVGDMNRSDRIPIGPKWERISLPADLGRNRYTHCYVRPNGAAIEAKSAGEAHNPSDHDTQFIRITLGEAA